MWIEELYFWLIISSLTLGQSGRGRGQLPVVPLPRRGRVPNRRRAPINSLLAPLPVQGAAENKCERDGGKFLLFSYYKNSF